MERFRREIVGIGTLNKTYAIWALAASQLLAAPTWAREDLVPGSDYTSARGAAMGDAFEPLADDGASALFYNPAGLAKVKGIDAEPLNISFYGDTGYFGDFNLNSFYNFTSLSSYESTLQSNPNTFAGGGFAIAPTFSFRGFGFGVLLQAQTGAEYLSSASSINYRSLYQVVPTFGGALRLAEGIVRVGFSVQWNNEALGSINVPSTTTPLGFNQQLLQGSTIEGIVGAAITLPISTLPSFNLVVRNPVTTGYSSFSLLPLARNSTGTPTSDVMTVDGSFSMSPRLAPGTTLNLVVEDRDMTNTSGDPLLFGRLAMGAELMLRDTFFLRGGYSGGYPAAGIGIKRKSSEISITYYTEELGTSYEQQGDTRIMFQIQARSF